jgi:hypothetical protein
VAAIKILSTSAKPAAATFAFVSFVFIAKPRYTVVR